MIRILTLFSKAVYLSNLKSFQMKFFNTIVLLFFTICIAQSQEVKESFVGYMIVHSSSSIDSDIYISELLNCDFPKDDSKKYSEEYRVSEHFRKFVKDKYNFETTVGIPFLVSPL